MAERSAQIDAAGVVAGAALFLASWRLALRQDLHDHEVYVMGAMNTQPAVVHGPLAVVMQLGSLGGGLAVAGVLGLRGHRRAGLTTAAAVTLSWLGAKGVKAITRRGRPADHLEDIVVRGRTQSGFGFPSGHAAISAAAAVAASRVVPVPVAAGLFGAAAATGVARMYVGAHLPLDIVGGAGLGVALGCAARLGQ